MSRRYLYRLQQQRVGAQRQSIEAILTTLAERRPERAQQFAAIDWGPVIRESAERALHDVARGRGTFHAQFPVDAFTSSTARGTCVGAVSTSMATLGVFQTGTTLTFVHSTQSNARDVTVLKRAWERAYHVRALAAAMEILTSSSVETRERTSGTVLQATITEVQ